MVEKDLKRLIDALEERVNVLEEQLAFAQQENDSLRNELVNVRLEPSRGGAGPLNLVYWVMPL